MSENIVIHCGADFSRNISLTDSNSQPLNVSGYSANASMKIDPYANDAKSSYANAVVFNTLLSNGNLFLGMYANTTINIIPGFYWYDIIVYNGTETFYIDSGICEVDPGISQN